jgi:hypothetical protein
MIYEFRTYTLHPRTLTDFLKRWTDALPKRLELSPLTAFWYTDVGPLNQVIHVWQYTDTNERSRIRAEAVKRGIWPPKTTDLIADMRSDILEPLPFSPALGPSNHGPYFEMRSYTLRPGSIPEISRLWEKHLPARVQLSPLIGVLTSDIGGLNQWVHIWAYKSLDQRASVRQTALDQGIWPPPPPSQSVRQENKILLAAPFSPIK